MSRQGTVSTAAWLGLLLAAGLLWRWGCPAAWACAGQEQLLAQAATQFAMRQDLERAQEAAEFFRRALRLDPGCRTAAVGLARTSVYLGVLSSGDQERAAYREAERAGRLLTQALPHRPEGHYFLGMALALQANAAGFLDALALVAQAKESLTISLALDPSYDQGGAHRVLGRLYFKLPTFLGGDKELAERHLRQALELGPRYWLTHIYLAVLLLDQGRRLEAVELLRKVVAGPAGGDQQAEYALWLHQAQDLLRQTETP